MPYDIKYSDNPLLNEKYDTPLFLKKPSVYSYETNYDAKTGNFIITPKVGDITIGTPTIMSFEEYNKYRERSIISQNWKQTSKKTNSDEDFLSDFLNPKLNLGIKGMDKIFGTDEVTVTPHGSIDLSLGISYNNIQNYSLAKRVRRPTSFDYTRFH